MAGPTNVEDCIVLSDEGSQDVYTLFTPISKTSSNSRSEAKSKTSESFLKIVETSTIALAPTVSTIAASANESTGTPQGAPQKETSAAAELGMTSSSIKGTESMLTQLMGQMPPAQLAEVAKHAMIDIVRQFPPLWKSTNEYYYNTQYCALLWTNIAGVLNIDVKTAKTRWRKLRDLYKKEYLKGKQTGCESQNPLVERLNFLEEEILLIKQRADKLRGVRAKPPTSSATQTVNQNTVTPDDNDDDNDDDDDCMIIDMDLNDDSHQDCQNANENEAKKLVDKPTSSANPILPMIQPRKLSELQNLLTTQAVENTTPPSLYYTRESVQQSAKRKSRSRSPEKGGKPQTVSIPSRTNLESPQSPAPEIEYADDAMRKKSKFFVAHAFPDIAWKKSSSQVMDSSITSNTLPNHPVTPVASTELTLKHVSRIKSTARKSTGSQYLPRPNPNAVSSSSTVAQVEERPSPQTDSKASSAAATKPKSPGVKVVKSSKSKTNKSGKRIKSGSTFTARTNPNRGSAIPAKPPGESNLPEKSTPADESVAPVRNVEAPAKPLLVKSNPANTTEVESGPAKPDTVKSAKIECTKPEPTDPDDLARRDWGTENANFLLSLLPEVNNMTDKQFRKLRKYSTALISLIMDGD